MPQLYVWTSQWLIMHWSSGPRSMLSYLKRENIETGAIDETVKMMKWLLILLPENDFNIIAIAITFAQLRNLLIIRLFSNFHLSHLNFHIKQVTVQFCLTPEHRNARRWTHRVYLIIIAVEMPRNLISMPMEEIKHTLYFYERLRLELLHFSFRFIV